MERIYWRKKENVYKSIHNLRATFDKDHSIEEMEEQIANCATALLYCEDEDLCSTLQANITEAEKRISYKILSPVSGGSF